MLVDENGIRSYKAISKTEACKRYLLDHSDATNPEVKEAVGCESRNVNAARAELEKEGFLQKNSNNRAKFTKHRLKKSGLTRPPEILRNLSGNALRTEAEVLSSFSPVATSDLYKLLESGEDPDIDDEKTRVAMLKQLRLMSFDASLHQSIRMSAMDLYNKLKETARGQTIGPGRPLTHADALDRLCLLFKAVGATLVLEATAKAFALVEGEQNGQENPTDQTPIREGTI